MTVIQVQVQRKVLEAQDIVSFELARTDGAPLPDFSAGSHIDVHTPGGLVRQYSLLNNAHTPNRYRIAVLRDPHSRGGSASMHEQVREGDLLTISEPRNHFSLQPSTRKVLVAGGIGITPLICMAHQLAAEGADFALHYCTRSPSRTAFREEIARSALAERVHFHFDDGAADQKLELAAALGSSGTGTHVYVCGPAGFIDWVLQGARALGFTSAQLHVEHFGSAAQDTAEDAEFTVRIASTGQDVVVPAKQTVVQALSEHGIEVLTSCEQGVCGTCITRVLEGRCDHRDLFFTDEEKARHDQFTPCCSRALGKLLVLDL